MMLGGTLAISDRRYRIHKTRLEHAEAHSEAATPTAQSRSKGRASTGNVLATKGKQS